MVYIDLGHATAIMPPPEQIEREQYRPGDRVKVYIAAVNMTPKGPEIVVSRAHAEIVRRLFTVEVPELQNDSVEIKAIAREAGLRTKLAVFSEQKNIDPVGSLVGQRGTRVQTVISELGGEKIDIIEWSSDPVKYITNALSPAKVISIKLDETSHTAVAEVKEDQLSLAIGKAGQNVRLAAKLTGWKIDLVGDGGEKTEVVAGGEAPVEDVAVTEEVPADAEAPVETEVVEQPAVSAAPAAEVKTEDAPTDSPAEESTTAS
jgi:N utilization substance protein A